MGAVRGTVLDQEWYKSREGNGLLASLTNPTTGHRKLYGLLEQPPLPPSIPILPFKLFLVGRAGVGKTCTASWLAGLPGWSYQLGESPGVRTTQVYWPARVAGKLLLFRLQLWDAGDAAVRKYGHVYPVCREGASGVLLVFSYSDRASWEELPGLIQRTVMQDPGVLPVIVGNKYGNPADNEVSQAEVAEAESSWSIPIVRIRHQSQNPAPGPLPEVAAALNTICEQLYLAKHRQKLTVEPALI